MKTFTEYYEEKETEEIFQEGFANVIGNILGFGTTTVLSAWAAALIIKGGVGAINSIANSFGKKGLQFKKDFRNDAKNSQAVKQELSKMEVLKNKYGEEIQDIIDDIKVKNVIGASEKFKDLPKEKQNSTEIRQLVIEEIVKAFNQVPVSEPTPGNECYRAIRKIIDMATAKAAAKAIQQQMQKYIKTEE